MSRRRGDGRADRAAGILAVRFPAKVRTIRHNVGCRKLGAFPNRTSERPGTCCSGRSGAKAPLSAKCAETPKYQRLTRGFSTDPLWPPGQRGILVRASSLRRVGVEALRDCVAV